MGTILIACTLGYALIMQCFNNNPEAMGDALIISELGAGVPLFLLAIPFSFVRLPAGAIAAVVAARYGCNGGLASALVIAMYILSLGTIQLIYMLTISI